MEEPRIMKKASRLVAGFFHYMDEMPGYNGRPGISYTLPHLISTNFRMILWLLIINSKK
jgi:hypothetical protein